MDSITAKIYLEEFIKQHIMDFENTGKTIYRISAQPNSILIEYFDNNELDWLDNIADYYQHTKHHRIYFYFLNRFNNIVKLSVQAHVQLIDKNAIYNLLELEIEFRQKTPKLAKLINELARRINEE